MKLVATLSALALFLGACADAGTDAPSDTGIAINLAALNASNITYAEYTIVVKNGAATTISTATVDSTSYQVGAPSLVRYVAPCDAGSNNNTVEVTVNALEVGGEAIPTASLPAPQTKSVLCVENQSTQVDFDFYAVASAQLGFFDITVGTEIISCSAKLDCETGNGFFPTGTSGAVLGFSCTMPTTNSPDPVLHLDAITLTCTGNTATVHPTIAGNLDLSDTTYVSDAGGLLDSVTVSRGQDVIGSVENTYWNVALGLDSTNALGAGITCTLTTKGTVTDGMAVLNDRPYVTWSVGISNSGLTCDTHPLFGTDTQAGVSVGWPSSGTAASFNHTYTGPPIAFVSSTTFTPGGGIGAADSACQSLASTEGLLDPTSYKAWLSTSTVDAVDHVKLSPEPLYMPSGALVTANASKLLRGELTNAINEEEDGLTTVSSTSVWTGTLAAGTKAATHCTDWTLTTGDGTVGTQATDGSWTNTGTPLACTTAARLICFQVQ